MKVTLLVLAAAFAVTGSEAFARDRAMLNKALELSLQERANVENTYKAKEASNKASAKVMKGPKAINLEIGDELGVSESGEFDRSSQRRIAKERPYREKAESKKLDQEWNEVNQSMREYDETGTR